MDLFFSLLVSDTLLHISVIYHHDVPHFYFPIQFTLSPFSLVPRVLGVFYIQVEREIIQDYDYLNSGRQERLHNLGFVSYSLESILASFSGVLLEAWMNPNIKTEDRDLTSPFMISNLWFRLWYPYILHLSSVLPDF